MQKNIIVCIVSIVLALIFLALTSLWTPFCLFASLCFLVGVSVPAYCVLVNYVRSQNQLKEQRFVDAYLYADEQQNAKKIKDFKYDKKTERKLRRSKHNNFASVFSLGFVWVLAIVLLVLSIKIVFF